MSDVHRTEIIPIKPDLDNASEGKNMPNASISIQILPLGRAQKSSLKIIDSAIELIKKSGVSYEVGPMETTMEGDLDKLLEIVKKIQYLSVKNGSKTVFSNIKIIYNPKGVMTINQKTEKFR